MHEGPHHAARMTSPLCADMEQDVFYPLMQKAVTRAAWTALGQYVYTKLRCDRRSRIPLVH